MALKYNKSKVRLWEGVGKMGDANIGIRFNRSVSKKEIKQIYNTVKSLLMLKYGKGVK